MTGCHSLIVRRFRLIGTPLHRMPGASQNWRNCQPVAASKQVEAENAFLRLYSGLRYDWRLSDE
jgi:hypothetical protein